jgi:hypothetical protein
MFNINTDVAKTLLFREGLVEPVEPSQEVPVLDDTCIRPADPPHKLREEFLIPGLEVVLDEGGKAIGALRQVDPDAVTADKLLEERRLDLLVGNDAVFLSHKDHP